MSTRNFDDATESGSTDPYALSDEVLTGEDLVLEPETIVDEGTFGQELARTLSGVPQEESLLTTSATEEAIDSEDPRETFPVRNPWQTQSPALASPFGQPSNASNLGNPGSEIVEPELVAPEAPKPETFEAESFEADLSEAGEFSELAAPLAPREDASADYVADGRQDTGILRRSLVDSERYRTDQDETVVHASTQIVEPVLPADMPETTARFFPSPTSSQSTEQPSITQPATQPAATAFENTATVADDSVTSTKFDTAIMDGATILPTVPSRAGARWLSAIGIFVLTLLAWYLLTDAATRLTVADGSPLSSGNVNLAALAELAGGLATLVVIALLAAQSALGLTISGAILTLVGAPFLAVPGMTIDVLNDFNSSFLSSLGGLGDNIYFGLAFTGASGILMMVGIAMLCGGWVTYQVRRKGRAEETLRQEVAAINPQGLKARWAQKATR